MKIFKNQKHKKSVKKNLNAKQLKNIIPILIILSSEKLSLRKQPLPLQISYSLGQ